MRIPRIKIKKHTGSLTVLGFSLFVGALVTHKTIPASIGLQFLACSAVVAATQKNEEINPVKEALNKIELEREQMNLDYIAKCEELETSRVRYETDSETRIADMEEAKKAEIEGVIGLYEQELNTLTEALLLRENIIANSKLPKLSKGIGRVDVIANRIIDFYHTRHLTLDYADGWQEVEYDLIRLTPRFGSKKDVEQALDDLQLELKLNSSPSVDIVQGTLQFRLNTSNVKTEVETAPKREKPTVVTGDWLRGVAAKIIHAKVDGETQSGKSTLVQNLATLFSDIHTDAEFISIDPKYPMSVVDSPNLQTWRRNPAYKGIETALEGLKDMAVCVERRLELLSEDVANGCVPRTFPKKVYVIDEIDWIMSRYGKDATNALQVGLKVGAALNVVVVYLGQSPRCSKLGMTKDDFRNTTNISLAQNIPDALNTYVYDEQDRKDLLSLYYRETNSGNVYIALVMPKGQRAFLGQMPKPNAYLDASSESDIKGIESQIIQLHLEGLKPPQIVESIWGIKHSKSENYRVKRDLVLTVLNKVEMLDPM
jgi:hypothetical protein